MKPDIKSYNDLVRTQEQMESILRAQKDQIVAEFAELKNEFKPTVAALRLLGKGTTRDKGNSYIISGGVNTLIDLVVKKFILAKAGWFTKFIVPLLLKNYSSHYVAEHKGQLIDKIMNFIKPKNANGKAFKKNRIVDEEGAL